ncbi:trihelix transcription factor GT-2-like [Cotesia glomerata]|uniref:trihelix transcription factor GT-2-like n=1 Tax=Cotesia glomerata TaxID=32391 RepID=UPI001D0197DA|nr:trihelix transcription factor GT-2-like [Cotesia glomerata]XP_044581092.1 trihelix transcription factor GT-2-like [Cotesia glomerata]XP_044581093.1 trihelix transcription factor GT-2-like [Cotesia glomerata]XP_044581095.1 trihelix transcription factor GT-2-like [Cotesia glomerata]
MPKGMIRKNSKKKMNFRPKPARQELQHFPIHLRHLLILLRRSQRLEKSFNKPKATKLSGKERNNKDDNNKGADVKNWSKNEVLLLIEIYKEYQLEFLDANITNGDVWVKIATKINETLNQQGLPPIPAEKCKTKWETLKRRYKSLKDSQKTSGNAPMTWPFYDEMEEVFGEQPWVKPLSTAGSNTTNKMDPDVISPPRKRQKTLTNYCEELLAAKK